MDTRASLHKPFLTRLRLLFNVSLIVILSVFAAGAQDTSPCAECACIGDRDGDGTVTVDEAVEVIGNALNGCPQLRWYRTCLFTAIHENDVCPPSRVFCTTEENRRILSRGRAALLPPRITMHEWKLQFVFGVRQSRSVGRSVSPALAQTVQARHRISRTRRPRAAAVEAPRDELDTLSLQRRACIDAAAFGFHHRGCRAKPEHR